MHEAEQQSILRRTIANDLVSLGFLNHSEAIASWDIWPNRDCDVAVRVTGPVRVTTDTDESSTSLVGEVEAVGQYLNIRLRLASLIELVGSVSFGLQPTESAAMPAAIEHTSLTPAYPINLATFRSTAIGVALGGLLRNRGYDPKSYFWVEDEAAQMRLLHEVASYLRRKGMPTDLPHGKPDHVLGRLLVQARYAMRGATADDEILSRMFPEAIGPPSDSLDGFSVTDPYATSEAVREGSKLLAAKCLSGFSDTFESTGVAAPEYVLGSVELQGERLVRAWDWQRSHERASAAGPAYITESGGPSYLIRNVAWFDWLMERADSVIVVVPARQEAVVERAVEIVRHGAGERVPIVHVPFGDVLNEDGKLDRPSAGRFTSVDEFLVHESERLGWSTLEVAASLRLFLLARSPRNQIVLGDRNHMHDTARAIHRLTTGDEEGDDSERMRRVCKRLLDLGHAIHVATERLDPSLIVREVDALARDAAIGCLPSVRGCARDAVRELLELLGFRKGSVSG